MDCREYRIKLIELAESRALEAFPPEMQRHENDCADCLAFANALKAEYAYVRHEKNEPVNPYLADKIIYKMSFQPTRNGRTASLYRRVAIYGATVLLGFVTGISANYFFMNDPGQTDDAPIPTEQAAFMNDDENNVLSLNE